MAYPALPNPSEVENVDLPWGNRVQVFMALFTGCIGIAIAAQRHEFTSPNVWWFALALAVGPWILDALPVTRGCVSEDLRHGNLLVSIWSASVLTGVAWLVATYHGPDDVAPFLVALLIGEMSSTNGWRFGAAVWAVSIGALATFMATEPTYGMWIWGFAFTVGWMGGVAYRRQVQVAYVLTQAQTQLAEHAAKEERHRLARDVHDLVAHSLAVTMLQLSGARLALRDGETSEALEALQEAETAGRRAMAEIHRTVGLLGSGHGSDDAPTPGATDVPDLVSDFRRAGLRIDFDLEGDLEAVPLTIGLASYRLVQESLSNAVKHAPGAPVHLQIRVNPRDIEILAINPVVTDAGQGSMGGNGLRGMAERAELLGGVASAGNGNGSWKVRATIPWHEPLV